MFNTSQVVLRNQERLADDVLVIGPPDDDALAALPTFGATLVDHLGTARHLAQRLQGTVVFGCDGEELGERPYSQALIYMPKARQELAMKLALAEAWLPAGGEVLLVGAKREGIASGARMLQESLGAADKIDTARHCQLWAATAPHAGKPFRLTDWLTRYPVEVAGTGVELAGLPGVFSEGRLDEGTRLLLATFTEAPSGPVLDFACGAGVVGTWLARRYGLTPDMVDVQAQAIACARLSLEWNQVEGRVWASDAMEEVSSQYGLIVTNPPFHTGVKVDIDITSRFLASVTRHLRPGGELRLVANRFLPYAELIERHLGSSEVLAENSRFRVYRARRSR